MTKQAQTGCTSYVVLLAFGMLLTGTINTVLQKVLIQEGEAEGCCGYTLQGKPNPEPHHFEHPWFQTWVMFVGELLCVIPFVIMQNKMSAKRDNYDMVDMIGDKNNQAPSPFSYIFAIPAACDLAASTLGSIALLWIPASIWQMMRGANIIFAGILSVIFLKAKFGAAKWLGIFLVVSGLVCVGLAGFLEDIEKHSHDIDDGQAVLFSAGILLVLGAQLVAATQSIVEEKLLKGSGFQPLNVVFMEGFWGVAILTLFGLPLVFFLQGSFGQPPIRPGMNFTVDPVIQIYSDNAIDAFVQMKNHLPFLLFQIGVIFSIASFNFFGLTIITKLTAVHRMLIDACRTMFVWASLVVFGYFEFEFGEELSYYSFIQGAGFLLLVSGTLIYNEVIKIPCFTYVQEDENQKLLN